MSLRGRRMSAALVSFALAALAGCAAQDSTDAATSAVPAAEVVRVSDAWVKAGDAGMTGLFAVLDNDGDAEVTVEAAATDAASATELHETVADSSGTMTMREVSGGFTIPGESQRVLEPGGDHLMLMGLTGPLAPGEEVSVELSFSDGSTLEFSAPVKDFAGANESYEGEAEHSGNH
ncbi:copper chaperone PCu(A)C [Salinibacterium sp. dk2585]|nr:copper chaperone PCu(A)C [Salinibacterium sp. dk2585]TXK53692.1 copper chaperone PCu(A)C [Salinibacterium sp. dk5596]